MKTNKRKPKRKPDPEFIRGIPRSEYKGYARLVAKGVYTWDQLEAAGKVGPNARWTKAYREHVEATKAKPRKGGAK